MKQLWILIWFLLPALACNFNAGATQPVPDVPVDLVQPTVATIADYPVLIITETPTAIETAVVTSVTAQPTNTPIPCTLRTSWPDYTVRAGDTLFRIARRAHSTVDALVAANCLSDRNYLAVGQTLYVPQSIQPTPTPQPTVISDWTNPVVYAANQCFTSPFAPNYGVAVSERWRVADYLTTLTLHKDAVVNQPTAVLGVDTPFTIADGPVCFTAEFGATTLVFRRWRVTTLDGDLSGWIDEIDPFTNLINITP